MNLNEVFKSKVIFYFFKTSLKVNSNQEQWLLQITCTCINLLVFSCNIKKSNSFKMFVLIFLEYFLERNSYIELLLLLQALAELCEIKFGKTHPVCNLVSLFMKILNDLCILS